MRWFGFLAGWATLIVTAEYAFAHPGGLDANGCHRDRKNGGYHCHASATPSGGGKPYVADVSDLSGVASVIDGDTLEIRGVRVRLHGIDAPESGQTCKDGSGRIYRCGQQAALNLADFIGRRPVSCSGRDSDRYRRTIAVCKVGATDINEWLVREGWAIAYRQFSLDYVAAEQEAKMHKRGIWTGYFEAPSEFRKRNR
jgi:Micrococcal nuclease (thermonuclease) homologs